MRVRVSRTEKLPEPQKGEAIALGRTWPGPFFRLPRPPGPPAGGPRGRAAPRAGAPRGARPPPLPVALSEEACYPLGHACLSVSTSGK